MAWFEKLCRNTGLMIHNAITPVREDQKGRHEVKRTVQEQQVSPTVTLRRTTIEEVEIKQDRDV